MVARKLHLALLLPVASFDVSLLSLAMGGFSKLGKGLHGSFRARFCHMCCCACGAGKFANDARQKLAFTLAAIRKGNPLKNDAVISAESRSGLQWLQTRKAWQITRDRERVVRDIEDTCAEMWINGTCDEWFSDADASVRRVAETVNGGLFQQLLVDAGGNGFAFARLSVACMLVWSGYDDVECVEMFRKGANACSCAWLACCGISCRCTFVRRAASYINWRCGGR